MGPTAQGSGESFLLGMAAAYYHPRHPDFYVQLLGDTVFLTNIPGSQDNEYVVVASLPVGQWFNPQDRHGRPVPVSLWRTETGQLHGAWI